MSSVDKIKFYLDGLKKGYFKDSFWVKSCLSVFKTECKDNYLVKTDNNGFYYLDENNNRVDITGNDDTSTPLLKVNEIINLPAGYLPNQKEDLRTSVGCLLQNYLLVIDPFRGKVPYFNRRFFPKDVENYIVLKWFRSKDDVTDENPELPDEIFTEDYLKYTENGLHLVNYTQTVVPSITERSLKRNPILEKRKKELYEEYGDKINDPVIASKIDEELCSIDREWLKDDESSGFLIKDKAFTDTRKRLNSHFGTPAGITNKQADFVNRSLRDGIDLNRLSIYVNDAYSGSIGRGIETQEGGVRVKNATRSAANLKVVDGDCGTKHGQKITIPENKEKAIKYINYWYINDKKESVKITNNNIDSLLGKEIDIRSPSLCINKNNSYCSTCVGPNIASYPNGIAMVNSILGTIVMLVSMSAMHNKKVKTTKWKKSLLS